MKERGSATIWVLAGVLVLSAAAGLVLSVGLVAVDRHRAATVADMSALAAAAHSIEGAGLACAAARRVAQASRSRLVGCRLEADGAVRVDVEVPLSGPLAGLPVARVSARAGSPTAR